MDGKVSRGNYVYYKFKHFQTQNRINVSLTKVKTARPKTSQAPNLEPRNPKRRRLTEILNPEPLTLDTNAVHERLRPSTINPNP